MPANSVNYIQYNKALVQEIFKQKKEFHQEQAQLPIEEKIRILIELQKIALTIRPKRDENDTRAVWRI
jgi:arginyl-tRNA synthetase